MYNNTPVVKPRPNTKNCAPCEEEIKELQPFWSEDQKPKETELLAH